MTTTLKIILDHVDDIKTACDTFGFQKPQFYCCDEEDFCLSVEQDLSSVLHKELIGIPESTRRGMLAFYLTEYFQCNVVVYSKAKLGNQTEQLDKCIDLNAGQDQVASLFSVKNLADKTFEKDADPPQNSIGGINRLENLEMIKSLGLPLSIESTISKRKHSVTSSGQSTFFNRQESDQNNQSIERVRKKLKNLIDSNPELKADVEKDPDAIFDALKEDYKVNVSSTAAASQPLRVS